ncbi:MAG: DUF202 domain-containing protein [Methylotenera sp.]|uniref:YidH family protein n=1 Tax=Methylotenera sp. TaxID=2051956 RepID=UPI002487E2A6|nr:DUF202 domain-containing protein [Methylotenera sp.]MDI1308985.1 DUF202 domain-containing protein [Methylotenera sp.]
MASDPSVFFAAERTLLAWLRSSMTVMALGFVVAKFGLFLSVLSLSNQTNNTLQPSNGTAGILGVSLVMIGVIISVGAQLNHYRYLKTLPPEDVPKLAIPWLASLFSFSIALVGLLLAGYLFIAK